MTSAGQEAPMTAQQVRARLDEIAPYPSTGGPGTARALAAWLAVDAQRRQHRTRPDPGTGPEAAEIMTFAAEFAAVHMLTVSMRRDPGGAEFAASQVTDALADGGAAWEWLGQHLRDLGIDTDEVNRLEEAWQALPEVKGRPGELTASERDLIRADLGQLLEALGLGDYARPESSHEVMQQCIAEVGKRRKAVGTLARIIDGQSRAMEAARIEMGQNGPHAAMQWILNSLPDVWDNPETAWDGKESAQEWFDRVTGAEKGEQCPGAS